MSQFEEEYVSINGIEHYLLHYPKGPDAPVLLYLHGGPGNFESVFAYELDGVWKDRFTYVHWDQRGAGKTLRQNKTETIAVIPGAGHNPVYERPDAFAAALSNVRKSL